MPLLAPRSHKPLGPFVTIPAFRIPSSPCNNYFALLSSALWTLCKSLPKASCTLLMLPGLFLDCPIGADRIEEMVGYDDLREQRFAAEHVEDIRILGNV